MDTTPIIVGAGWAGMIAAERWSEARIYEIRSPSECSANFIRMRADSLANALKLPATKVTAYSCVLSIDGDSFSYRDQATPADMINYSRKVIGVLSARSIMSTGRHTRWVVGADALLELRHRHRSRIKYNAVLAPSHWADPSIQIINTAPLECAADALEIPLSHGVAAHTVTLIRAPVLGADSSLSVTLYVPSPDTPVSRITLSEGWLVLELTHPVPSTASVIELARASLGLHPHELGEPQSITQPSKLAPQSEEARAVIYAMSINHNVWSLGRHATARPGVLIEHLPHDCDVISRLIALRSESCQYKSLLGAIKR